jgi:hypothetical protein
MPGAVLPRDSPLIAVVLGTLGGAKMDPLAITMT